MSIGNHQFAKWPPNGHQAALDYSLGCTAFFHSLVPGETGTWGAPREDRHGNWTVATLRAPWSIDQISPVPTDPALEVMLEDAVIVDEPEWPIED